MRVLFAIIPARGHLHVIVPLARALETAGHEVWVASHAGVIGFWDMAEMITADALTAVPLGDKIDVSSIEGFKPDEELDRTFDALAGEHVDKDLLETSRQFVAASFFSYYPATPPAAGPRPVLADLVEVTKAWQPDLVIWDPLFLPAPVAARLSGAADARFLASRDYVGWARAQVREVLADRDSPLATDRMAELMRPVLRQHGLEFDEELLVGQWSIDAVRSQHRLPLDLPYVPVRFVQYGGSAAVPDWLLQRPERPRVCMSLGVSEREDLIDRKVPIAGLLEVVAGLDVDVVAALNADQLRSLGDVPANVRPIGYLPLNLLLPTCSAIIHHGGDGTVAAAVAHEVPQLITPQGGLDYADVAKAVADRGAGLVVNHEPFSVEATREQLTRILTEPEFRAGAAALRADTLSIPSPYEIVRTLEQLTERHRR